METPAEFRTQLGAVLEAYFKIHKALAGDDPEATQTTAAAMQEQLGNVDMALLEGDVHMVWMEHLKNLNAALGRLVEAKPIENQREAFYSLSQQLTQTVQVFPVPQPVYKAYCPMAFNDAGAFWLQDNDEVLNPYFGAMMLRCGEVQGTLGEGADHE
jgi:Cu(I)/Ag(I) efflux system membrane fusion protein